MESSLQKTGKETVEKLKSFEGLKTDVTNGEVSLCVITEKQLEAIKELVRREQEEHKEEVKKSFEEGYNKGKKDMEMGQGLVKDKEFNYLVVKLGEKLRV